MMKAVDYRSLYYIQQNSRVSDHFFFSFYTNLLFSLLQTNDFDNFKNHMYFLEAKINPHFIAQYQNMGSQIFSMEMMILKFMLLVEIKLRLRVYFDLFFRCAFTLKIIIFVLKFSLKLQNPLQESALLHKIKKTAATD